VFIRREDAERFVGGVRGDDPELASYLRIEERELALGGVRCEPLTRDGSGVEARVVTVTPRTKT
jgi:hypothetical protein